MHKKKRWNGFVVSQVQICRENIKVSTRENGSTLLIRNDELYKMLSLFIVVERGKEIPHKKCTYNIIQFDNI